MSALQWSDRSKIKCRPEGIEVMENTAQVLLQNLLDHTSQRLIKLQSDVFNQFPDILQAEIWNWSSWHTNFWSIIIFNLCHTHTNYRFILSAYLDKQSTAVHLILQASKNWVDKGNCCSALIPLKCLGENASEARNKLYKKSAGFSIWKLTRGKRQLLCQSPIQDRGGIWLKTDDEKASAFTSYLASTFMPFNLTDDTNRETIVNFLDTPTTITTTTIPIRHTSPQEVMMQLKALQPKKNRWLRWHRQQNCEISTTQGSAYSCENI